MTVAQVGSTVPVPSIANFEDAAGIAASDIPALKLYFGPTSANGTDNVLTDVVGGLTLTADNPVVFSQHTHGWTSDGDTAAIDTLVGSLPTIGTKSFTMFARMVSTANSRQHEIGDSLGIAGGGVSLGVNTGTGSYAALSAAAYLGFGVAESAALITQPEYLAMNVVTASNTAHLLSTSGSDLVPNDSGTTIAAGISLAAQMSVEEIVVATTAQGGLLGLLVYDSGAANDSVILRGLGWLEANGGALLPPMWKGLS